MGLLSIKLREKSTIYLQGKILSKYKVNTKYKRVSKANNENVAIML